MTVGNFSPFLGSLGDDPLFDSFFADDNNNNLQANSLEIVYGLPGIDNLTTSDLNFTSDDVAVLVGGDGGDNYLVRDDSTVVVFDNGNSNGDNLTLGSLSNADRNFLTIDGGRHLYLFNETTNTYLLLPDYQEQANQIEFFNFANGDTLSYEEFTEEIDDAISNNEADFLGDFTFAELEADSSAANPDVPEAARLDFDAIGLSPSKIDSGLQEIADTANNFEDNIIATDQDIDGDLDSRDNSYIYDDDRYFYDLYSLDQSVFNSGDIANVTLTSNDFNPLLFVLDSRGNVVEFDDNASDDSSELAFVVGSGEPLFIAVESQNSRGSGDYDLTFNRVEADISGIDLDETNIDEIPLFGIDTIKTTDSLTGSLTTEDLQDPNTADFFYFDNVLLVDGSEGDRVIVSLDSDFDALLSVRSIDTNGNIDDVADASSVVGAGVEQSTFTIQAGLDYIFTIDTPFIDVTGNYTLSTELS